MCYVLVIKVQNKVMETDLQQLNYAKTPCKGQLKVVFAISPSTAAHYVPRKFDKTASVLIQIFFFLFQVPFNIATKTFLSHPRMQK